MRSYAWVLGVVLGCALSAFGCGRPEPMTVRDVTPSPSPGMCPCAATVETLSAPVEPTPTIAARQATRLQETVSLGYAGDKPLTQIPTRREWWGDHDRAPVAHGGYGGYAYGYGGRGAPRGSNAGPSAGAPSQGFAAPPVQHGMGMRFGGGPPGAAPSPPASPASHAPR